SGHTADPSARKRVRFSRACCGIHGWLVIICATCPRKRVHCVCWRYCTAKHVLQVRCIRANASLLPELFCHDRLPCWLSICVLAVCPVFFTAVTTVVVGRNHDGADTAPGCVGRAGGVARLAGGGGVVFPWLGDLDAGRRDLSPAGRYLSCHRLAFAVAAACHRCLPWATESAPAQSPAFDQPGAVPA